MKQSSLFQVVRSITSIFTPPTRTDILNSYGAAPLEDNIPLDCTDSDIAPQYGDYVVIHAIRDYYGYVVEPENAVGRTQVYFFDDILNEWRRFFFFASTLEVVFKRDALLIDGAAAVAAIASETTA